jgi:lipopolysaccharide/colanic/teichoic acid biosynthesis glycosyltransferase
VIKRLLDASAALLGLIVLAPLFAAIALAIKLTSPGPVFFRQERVGKDFKPFWIYKFRSMVVNAPQLGGQLTSAGDPRVTRIGRLLRKTKLDELPQLINVLKGDMSLVGPRPEVPRYVQMFRDDYRELLRVRPGITDLASVKYRDESEILGQSPDPEAAYVNEVLPDKIALAKEYLAHRSLLYDLGLIARTAWKIVR